MDGWVQEARLHAMFVSVLLPLAVWLDSQGYPPVVWFYLFYGLSVCLSVSALRHSIPPLTGPPLTCVWCGAVWCDRVQGFARALCRARASIRRRF
jgi:hypothetical protein